MVSTAEPLPTHPVDPARVEAALRRTIYRDAKRELRVGDLVELFLDAGLRVFIVGGAPRDWLLGQPGRDIDLSMDRPLEEAHRLLREAHPDIDPVLLRLERFGTLRWGNEAGGVDLNILRSWKDIQNDEMWTTTFVAREDLREDALTRDFSLNAFFYDCRERVLWDPLGCGLEDLHARRLRLITHPRVLDTSYRTTFRILQFLCRGYVPTSNVLEHLERSADHDIQGMEGRLRQWIPNHLGPTFEHLDEFKRRLYACARQEKSRAILDALF
jgi:poly(A) polymerase